MPNSPSSNTTVLPSTGRLLPPNHLTETLLFSRIDEEAAKSKEVILNINNFNELDNIYSNIITVALVIIVQWNLRHCRHPFDDAQDKLEAPNKRSQSENQQDLIINLNVLLETLPAI
jgi:hypothetical protein